MTDLTVSGEPAASSAASCPAAEHPKRPFAIQLHWRGPDPSGTFRPGASMHLNASLRTSGLLPYIPAEELRSLLLMLTFLHPNGHCLPTVTELSPAMRVSPRRARARMLRLAEFSWEGRALAIEVRRESGLHAFSPSPHLVSVDGPGPLPGPPPEPPLPASQSEAVIASSRERYARTRVEVEAEIAGRMGWDPPESEDDSEGTRARRQPVRQGVPRDQADALVAGYPADAILRQIEWLPYRGARNRAAFLAAAIEGSYAPPPGVGSPGPGDALSQSGADGAS